MCKEPIGIGIIGLGTVGQGVIKLLHEQAQDYQRRIGRPLEIRRALVRSAGRSRDVRLPDGVVTDDPDAFFRTPGMSIVVEVAGGVADVEPLVRRALEEGKHIVTANKSLLAARGPNLYRMARERGVSIAFEASCGGGLPILAALKFSLAANRIEALYGILNGTCNYILTKMRDERASYTTALAAAQDEGYAEADPTLDVGGRDAAQKLAIIASLSFGTAAGEADVSCEGIDSLELIDLELGRELGYVAKLLAIGETGPDGLSLRVHPGFIDARQPLAQVRGAFNALSVYGHALGHTLYYGRGAGQMPTASAIVADLLNVAGGWYPHAYANLCIWPDQHDAPTTVDPDALRMRYYLRASVRDRPGVMAQITKVLGDLGISLSAVLQHEPEDPTAPHFVPVVVTTHRAAAGAVRVAADRIGALDVVRERPKCLPIIDLPEA